MLARRRRDWSLDDMAARPSPSLPADDTYVAMPTAFALDPRLAGDSIALAAWPLCLVRLMDDCRFPWLILVPAYPGLREIHDLPGAERGVLIEEIARAGRLMQSVFAAEKIDTAALGNQVPQLHVHVIARFADDAAWPNPVWSGGPRQPMTAQLREQRLAMLHAGLG
jgi:diadenosine tetraphosphate (Ap4A) HIT family hydrolase